jgi:hypothetical protein
MLLKPGGNTGADTFSFTVVDNGTGSANTLVQTISIVVWK